MKVLALMTYYLVARHLPSSENPFFPFGRSLRSCLGRRIFKKAGKQINVEKGAFFGRGSEIEIGDYSGIGKNAVLQGVIAIGNYVMMGPDVMIYTRNHAFEDLKKPMMFQGERDVKKVIIKDDVWIGARSILLPGVEVGEGAIIGAGSVVTKSIEPYSIVGGNPARVIGTRKASAEEVHHEE